MYISLHVVTPLLLIHLKEIKNKDLETNLFTDALYEASKKYKTLFDNMEIDK